MPELPHRTARPAGYRHASRLPALAALLTTVALAISAQGAGARPLLVTVDDLPMSPGAHPNPAEREAITRALLEVLERHDIQAVGLVTWRNMSGEADRRLLEMWLAAGHELGNHSYRHLSYTRTPSDVYIEDIDSARRELTAFLGEHGRELRFFRFPMLREGDTVDKLTAMRDYLERTGQRNLPVTIDNQDWSFEEPWIEAARRDDRTELRRIGEAFQESMRLAVRHHERTGDRLAGRELPQTLLLHATEIGTKQWDDLFTWLEQSGHRFAGADEVLADPIFENPPDYVGTHGPGLWDRMLSVQRDGDARGDIRQLLDEQSAAWSRGDLDAFCSIYADDAVFLSPSGLTRGRQAVLDRYRLRYPDRAAMGRLTLEVVEMRLAHGTEVSMMGDARPSRIHGVTVAARWHLERDEADDASGLTLIVFVPTPDGWRIAQDASM